MPARRFDVRMPAVRTVPQQDLAEQISQDGMLGPVTKLSKLPMMAQATLPPLPLTVGTNMVAHRLGRRMVGFLPVMVVGDYAQVRYVPAVDGDYDDTLFAKLESGTAATVTLMVW